MIIMILFTICPINEFFVLLAMQRQTTVTAYFSSKQLLLCPFVSRSLCQYSMAEENPAAQRQTSVTVYLPSKQLLLFVFARRSVCQYSMAEENPAAQTQTAVTAYFSSKQLLLFVFSMSFVHKCFHNNSSWLTTCIQHQEQILYFFSQTDFVSIQTTSMIQTHWFESINRHNRVLSVSGRVGGGGSFYTQEKTGIL